MRAADAAAPSAGTPKQAKSEELLVELFEGEHSPSI
jgi:hypothetical protein